MAAHTTTEWAGFYFHAAAASGANRNNDVDTDAADLHAADLVSDSSMHVKWSYVDQAGTEFRTAPILVNVGGAMRLYQGGDHKVFYCLDAVAAGPGGTVVWKSGAGGVATIGDLIRSTAYADASNVYVGSDDFGLYGFNRATGARPAGWAADKFTFGGRVRTHPTKVGTNIVAGAADGHLRGIKVADGTSAWDYSIGSQYEFVGGIAVFGGHVFVAATDGNIHQVDATFAPGTLIRKYPAAPLSTPTSPSIATWDSSPVVMYGSTDHMFYAALVNARAYGAKTIPAGTRIWTNTDGGDNSVTAAQNPNNGWVVRGLNNWRIKTLAGRTGRTRWVKDGGSGSGCSSGGIHADFATTETDILIGVHPGQDGRVKAFKYDDSPGGHSSLWKYPTACDGTGKFDYGSPIIANSLIYVADKNGTIWCFTR